MGPWGRTTGRTVSSVNRRMSGKSSAYITEGMQFVSDREYETQKGGHYGWVGDPFHVLRLSAVKLIFVCH